MTEETKKTEETTKKNTTMMSPSQGIVIPRTTKHATS
jgi:hypothetical protein